MTVSAARTRQSAAARDLLLGAVVLGLGVVMGRVVQLKVRGAPAGSPQALPVSSRLELSRRGDLLDRRGRVLATSTVGWRLFVDPRELDDPATIAVDLAELLACVPTEIDRGLLGAASKRYVVVAEGLDPDRAEAVRRAGLRGVGLEPHLVRHYPHGDLAAIVVGMVGREHTGLSGTEHVLDEALGHRDGRLGYVRDPRRRALWFAPDDHEPARDGRAWRLTLDLVVQRLAEARLETAVAEHRAAGGRLIVVDAVTGGILALADHLNPAPREDAHLRDPGRAIHPALGRNRCATDPYEPGSSFKPFVWSLATEWGRAAPDEVLPTPAEQYHRTSQGRRIRDTHLLGPVSWRTCLMRSLNSGMAIVAERMTDAEMQEVLARFGFGEPTRCGVSGESAGLVTPRSRWNHYTQTSVAMGHEIGVTALQMVRAFCAFARDGSLPALHLVEAERSRAVVFRRRACSPETARIVREVMRDSVREGTGRFARSQHYEIFGKSGTAQLPRPEGGGYYEDRYVSSFIGGAPFEDPRIVVLCVIDDPDKRIAHYGGAIAGPAVRDVIEATLPYLGYGSQPAWP